LRAVILAGGRGKPGCDPYTTLMPALVRWGIDRSSSRHPAARPDGFERIDISVGHLGGLIKHILGQRRAAERRILLRWEDAPWGRPEPMRMIEALDERSWL